MGQFISASVIEEGFPGEMICGTGADIIFAFPVMRQIMAWLGTRPATRKDMQKIFSKGHHVAVIPGGIAEMYLVSDKEEGIFLSKRHKTVRVALEEGAIIVPTFFFGNTRLYSRVTDSGSDSWIARISRKLRASVIFFYGRNFLTVPYRHPLRMVFGHPIDMVSPPKREGAEDDAASQEEKKEPLVVTDELVEQTLAKLQEEVERVYRELRPEWEDRPLVIH